jgi:hypothetical protein
MTAPISSTLDAFPVTTRRRALRRARTTSTRLQPGPTGPQPGITATPDAQARLALATCPVTAGGLFVVGAHGGAGETTVASWTGGRAAGHRWPVSATWSTPGNHPRPDGGTVDLVLVARTHARGLAAARQVLTQWAAGRLPANQLHGLVLIPDAPGRLPTQLAEQARLIAGGAPRAWLLPWLDELRLCPDPTDTDNPAALPRAVATFAEDLRASANPPVTQPAVRTR